MIIIDALFFQMATGNMMSMDDWAPHVETPAQTMDPSLGRQSYREDCTVTIGIISRLTVSVADMVDFR